MCQAIACDTLAAAVTEEASSKCCEAVLKIATSFASSGSERKALVTTSLLPPLLETLRAASSSSAVDKQMTTLPLATAAQALGRIALVSEAAVAPVLASLLDMLPPDTYKRAWAPCAADERLPSGKETLLAIIAALEAMAPVCAEAIVARALPTLLEPVVAAAKCPVEATTGTDSHKYSLSQLDTGNKLGH